MINTINGGEAGGYEKKKKKRKSDAIWRIIS